MPTSSIDKLQKTLAIVIGTIYLVGIFLPYLATNDADIEFENGKLEVYYGWEWVPFLVFFVLCGIIVGISFSVRIALRLFLIRTLLILFVPITIVTFLADSGTISPFAIAWKIGAYLNYTGILLTMVYGIIHFRRSYPKYKRMLEDDQKQSSDLLDSF